MSDNQNRPDRVSFARLKHNMTFILPFRGRILSGIGSMGTLPDKKFGRKGS
jgi:hypothetical protein